MTSTCEGVLEYDRHTHLSDRWFQSVTRKSATPTCADTRGAHTTITSSELLSRSVCAVARGGGSALEPATRAPSSDVD